MPKSTDACDSAWPTSARHITFTALQPAQSDAAAADSAAGAPNPFADVLRTTGAPWRSPIVSVPPPAAAGLLPAPSTRFLTAAPLPRPRSRSPLPEPRADSSSGEDTADERAGRGARRQGRFAMPPPPPLRQVPFEFTSHDRGWPDRLVPLLPDDARQSGGIVRTRGAPRPHRAARGREASPPSPSRGTRTFAAAELR